MDGSGEIAKESQPLHCIKSGQLRPACPRFYRDMLGYTISDKSGEAGGPGPEVIGYCIFYKLNLPVETSI